ncbi:NAD(P)H-dependent oxidoreductase [Aliarcobacter butzleri]|uniref:NAD(P)H-dependent oxidoreductase n=3 Tax=Aliarcobacter butzleri TaxID=28197 RepID=A0AAP4UR92_9BACT|nr:NAD(P)H-dependent oxidoreductase [Aliarcobacter butzleri]MCG3657866.1 NAD(P)H-dependent oxidoreductase [Aliarcobacter butzleri]MCG3671471.1 NAD(P)H-dependent oxidoreductase [Aliarcobacter butzleri]MCG3679969.1 NAD(P)H-dependent oxidoreductase [Aliarcobacter butzleri]MCG3690609.1 NAD(P)H-dependent oxidoreductase [Aliarcobacter butzleri]MCT7567515.1 NAD(P)H-dependent oxidoreductase [Aliarcobacter butzleri]
MKKVLILNGHKYYKDVSEGNLTKNFIDKATEFFSKNNFEVKYTHIEKGYDVEEECQKFEWADYVLFHYPVYWWSVSWIAKKYFDETFTQGRHYESDGRSRSDASKTYGSGGLLQGKKYMLSLIYNCPASQFDNKNGLYDGLSLDEAHVAIHKTFQFCGLKPLETYAVHDIFKGDLNLAKELEKFESVLKENFL